MTDEEAQQDVEAVCRQVHPRLLGALSLYCGDAMVAEDLAQESLLRLCLAWPTSKRPLDPMAWTYRVGTNLARSSARRRAVERRASARLSPQAATAAPGPDGVAVRNAVASLAPRQREALVARHFLGFSVTETASAMGCAPGTVTALTHQAVRALRTSGLLDDEPITGEVSSNG